MTLGQCLANMVVRSEAKNTPPLGLVGDADGLRWSAKGGCDRQRRRVDDGAERVDDPGARFNLTRRAFLIPIPVGPGQRTRAMNATESHQTESPEIVYGVAAISRILNEPNHRRCYHLLERGFVPGARKMGRGWALSVPLFRREMHGEAA